jgi:hypothetical protein
LLERVAIVSPRPRPGRRTARDSRARAVFLRPGNGVRRALRLAARRNQVRVRAERSVTVGSFPTPVYFHRIRARL